MISPLSRSNTLVIPSSDPLPTYPSSRFQQTERTDFICPVHLVVTLPVLMSHNITAPSLLSPTIFFPSGRQCNSLHWTFLQVPYSQRAIPRTSQDPLSAWEVYGALDRLGVSFKFAAWPDRSYLLHPSTFPSWLLFTH
jgi:hypothetical protein